MNADKITGIKSSYILKIKENYRLFESKQPSLLESFKSKGMFVYKLLSSTNYHINQKYIMQNNLSIAKPMV